VPAPGNHSKCYIADDSIAYVGSDNLYPNSNGEFGYLLEGAAVDDLIASYWDPTWTYSFPHAARWGD
jgi:phosphatidylserine/phosphatidylglycerophosphate/cardiolipin synthase-like enzyme